MGDAVGLWTDATRGELRLLAHAIRAGWNVPVERRNPIMQEVGAIFGEDFDPKNARQSIAAAWVFIAADWHNLRIAAECRELELLPAITEMRAQGLSVRDIGKVLNARGCRTRHGGKWNAASVRRMLAYLEDDRPRPMTNDCPAAKLIQIRHRGSDRAGDCPLRFRCFTTGHRLGGRRSRRLTMPGDPSLAVFARGV